MTTATSSIVGRFALAMEGRLRANDHKMGWRGLNNVWLTHKLMEEVGELVAVMMLAPETPGHQQDLLSEAADLANIAMMIADPRRKP